MWADFAFDHLAAARRHELHAFVAFLIALWLILVGDGRLRDCRLGRRRPRPCGDRGRNADGTDCRLHDRASGRRGEPIHWVLGHGLPLRIWFEVDGAHKPARLVPGMPSRRRRFARLNSPSKPLFRADHGRLRRVRRGLFSVMPKDPPKRRVNRPEPADTARSEPRLHWTRTEPSDNKKVIANRPGSGEGRGRRAPSDRSCRHAGKASTIR